MKKMLKADEIKIFSIASGVAVAKADYEQLILAVQRSADWGAATDADVTISHCATVGGSYEEFKVVNVAPGASESIQFQVNLVGVKDFFKITFEQATLKDLLVGQAVLADDRDVDTADVEELPVPAVINPTIVL